MGRREVTLVKNMRGKVEFAQQLHDVCKIMGAMPTLEFRGDVIHMLDNDVSTLSNAMDVLVWTMLKMQPGSSNRRRCFPVPMQVASMDALENNVRALGVGRSDDYRSL